jgi:hypothetical protein
LDSGQFATAFNTYLKQLKDFQGQTGTIFDPNTGEDVVAANLQKLATDFFGSIRSKIKSELEGDSTHLGTLKAALTDLTAKKGFLGKEPAWGQIADQKYLDDWVDSHKNGVNETVLKIIANYVKNNQAATNSGYPASQVLLNGINSKYDSTQQDWVKKSLADLSADDLMTIIDSGLKL